MITITTSSTDRNIVASAVRDQVSAPRDEARDVDTLIEGLPTRVRDIALLRGLGYSFREIGRQLGVTPQAVSLMLARHRRCLKSLSKAVEMVELSARAANALGRHKISTREEARQADVLRLLRYERNCGRKTFDEIERWLGQ
jgi:predicted transcriptional regulator